MKISIAVSTPDAKFSALALKGGMEENLGLVSSLGFHGVEISVRDPSTLDAGALRKLIKKHDVAVSAIGTGRAFGEDGLSFTDPDHAVREAAVERIKAQIDLAAGFEAVVILGLILGRREMNPETRRLALDCVRSCADHAVSKEARLAIEPINRYETGFINRVDQCLEFIGGIDSPSCGILLDTFHMNIEEPDVYRSIGEAGNLIRHVHVADSNRWHPGAGHLDFGRIIGALRETGYDGFLSAEILPMPDPRAAAAGAARTLLSLLGETG
ncbi:MAG: 5-keto-L-gluconate epimerase [bacterium]